MQAEPKCMNCAKYVQLMLLTREEDFKELNAKIAEIQRLHNKKMQALHERIALLELSLSK